MKTKDRGYTAEIRGDFVHLVTWGDLREEDLGKPAETALALAKEYNVHKLLDDIRKVNSDGISVDIQAKGLGILWKLRAFKKVAIVFQGNRELGYIFLSTLEAMHLDFQGRFKGFDNETDAVAWLQED